jgi:hypothetical protein
MQGTLLLNRKGPLANLSDVGLWSRPTGMGFAPMTLQGVNEFPRFNVLMMKLQLVRQLPQCITAAYRNTDGIMSQHIESQ